MRGASKSFRIPPVPAARPFAPRRSTIRPVALFSLIAALLLDRARPLPSPNILWIWFRRYADRVARDLNAGQPIHGTAGWLAAVCPWVLAALVVFYLLYYVNPLLGWVWTVAGLYACIGLRRVEQTLNDIFEALSAGDLESARLLLSTWSGEPASVYAESEVARAAVETALMRAHRELFGVLFWFIILPGPAGAILYRLAGELARRWGGRKDEEFSAFGRFSARAFHYLDWVPLRLTAIGFAIAGDFEDAITSWRTQASAWGDANDGVILASGAGALGVRLGGPLPYEGGVDFRPELGDGDPADAHHLQSTQSLLWRTLVVWVVLLLLLTLARWVGG